MVASALIAADGVAGLGRRLVNGAAPGEITDPGRVAMRADIDHVVACGFCPASQQSVAWSGRASYYLIASGRRINFAVTLPAQLANRLAAQVLEQTAFEQLVAAQFHWMKTSVSQAGTLCVGAAAGCVGR